MKNVVYMQIYHQRLYIDILKKTQHFDREKKHLKENLIYKPKLIGLNKYNQLITKQVKNGLKERVEMNLV